MLGPEHDFWSPERRRRLGLVMIALAVLLAGSALTWSWWRSSDPTLTLADLESVYRSPPTGDAVGWDRASTFSQPGDADFTLPVTQPPACVVLLVPNRVPASLDRVGAVLTPGLGSGIWSGSATTYRYATPALARQKFSQLKDAVDQCSSFRYADTRFQVSSTSAKTLSRARSDLTLLVTESDPDVAGPSRCVLMRYGNTVSWVTTAQRLRDPGTVADSLVAGFRDLR